MRRPRDEPPAREHDTSDIEIPWISSAGAYLVLIGTAGAGGRALGARIVPVVGCLELGRRPVADERTATLSLDDTRISARHARIVGRGGRFHIEDLRSHNGTLVDGVLASRAELKDGTLLFLGGQAATFRRISEEALAAVNEDLSVPFGPVATASPEMALAVRNLRRLASTNEEVALLGETGTGKEIYGRAVHRASGRRGPFVALNCAALPLELVESELFGYRQGAHSQAAQDKRGLIERAEGGTLFLDEIGDMPPPAQAKLLRFLQDRELQPLGSTRPYRVDVRIVAAMGELSAKTLRRDLLARLGAQPIRLPELRERREDIGALIHHFLGSTSLNLASAGFLALCLHDWPGNVRELQKVIREATVFAVGQPTIGLQHLPRSVAQRIEARTGKYGRRCRRSPRPAPGRDELAALLRTHQGRVADVARDLDRQWSVVWRWLGRYRLDAESFRRRG